MASAAAAPAAAAVCTPTEALTDFLRRAGGHVGPIEVAVMATGRGVRATEDIKEGQLLLSVPRSLLVRPLPPDTSKGGLAEQDGLCIQLLKEVLRGPDSLWACWISQLTDQLSHPLFWPEAELAEVQCSTLEAKLGEDRASLAARFRSVQRHLPALSSQQYTWALATVLSRSSYMPGDAHEPADEAALANGDASGESGSCCLVPFGDMFNHDSLSAAVAEYDQLSQCYLYTAGDDIAKGEEVFLNYGAHDDATLLRLYGYVPSVNAHRQRTPMCVAAALQRATRGGGCDGGGGGSGDDRESASARSTLTGSAEGAVGAEVEGEECESMENASLVGVEDGFCSGAGKAVNASEDSGESASARDVAALTCQEARADKGMGGRDGACSSQHSGVSEKQGTATRCDAGCQIGCEARAHGTRVTSVATTSVRVAASLGINETDAAWLSRNELLSDLYLSDQGASWSLLATLRLKHASAVQREQGAALSILEGEPLGDGDSERAVWNDVLSMIKLELDAMPTTLHDDRDAMKRLQVQSAKNVPYSHDVRGVRDVQDVQKERPNRRSVQHTQDVETYENLPAVCTTLKAVDLESAQSAARLVALKYRITQKEMLLAAASFARKKCAGIERDRECDVDLLEQEDPRSQPTTKEQRIA